MKILTIADYESPYLWDYYEKGKLDGIDLILSAGDLAPQYLEFLATFFKGPVLYVHGNHDDCYDETPPEGCISVEDRIYEFNGLKIMGLGGSMRYNQGKYQYTEQEMNSRIRRMRFKIWKARGIDILLTHAPAKGINDYEDLPHQGFQCFRNLLDREKPAYFIHGHVHKTYGRRFKREDRYKDTLVVNAYERHILEVTERRDQDVQQSGI